MKTMMTLFLTLMTVTAFGGDTVAKRANADVFDADRTELATYFVQVSAFFETENDQTIMFNDMVVAKNRKSHITLTDDVAQTAYRFEMRVKDAHPINGLERVAVETAIYQMVDGEWVLQGEPTFKMAMDASSQIYTADEFGLMDVEMTISSGEPIAFVDSQAMAIYDQDQGMGCCSKPCGDGSGRTLKCCALSCSGCGTSVSCNR